MAVYTFFPAVDIGWYHLQCSGNHSMFSSCWDDWTLRYCCPTGWIWPAQRCVQNNAWRVSCSGKVGISSVYHLGFRLCKTCYLLGFRLCKTCYFIGLRLCKTWERMKENGIPLTHSVLHSPPILMPPSSSSIPTSFLPPSFPTPLPSSFSPYPPPFPSSSPSVTESSGGGGGDCIFADDSPLYSSSFRDSMQPLDRLVPSCEDLESHWKHLISLMSLNCMGLLISVVSILLNCITPCVEDRQDDNTWYPKTDVWYLRFIVCGPIM